MTGGDLVKYGLLGAAGYLAYSYMTRSKAIGGTHPASSEVPVAQQPPPASVLNTRDLVLAKAREALRGSTSVDFSDELLNTWEWCVFYDKVRGAGACEKIYASVADPARRISIDEFWTQAKAGGLSGGGCGSLPNLEAWREYMYSSGFIPNPWVT
jgi:hypothetical protein